MLKTAMLFIMTLLFSLGSTASAKSSPRVVFYGDSITQFWDLTSYFPGKPYLNRGSQGWTTTDMLTYFDQIVLNERPDVVVFLGGTNDVGRMTLPEIERKTESNLRAMIEMAKKHKVRIIVGSVPPASEGAWGMGPGIAPKLKVLNDWLAAYCLENHVPFVDYFSAMADRKGNPKPDMLRDGVHPNPAGYRVMTPLVAAALDELLAAK